MARRYRGRILTAGDFVLVRVAVVLSAMVGLFVLAAMPAMADDEPAFITIGGAYFGIIKGEDIQPEYRLEYRGKKLLGPIKPVIAAAGTACPGNVFSFCEGNHFTGSGFFGGGGMLDYYFGNRIVFSPSFGAFAYTGGNNDLDLDSPILFRYQLELGYRFDNRARLSVAISRYDNFGIGDTNPGVNSATLYYSIPTTVLFGK